MDQFTTTQNANLEQALQKMDRQMRGDLRAMLLQSGDEKYIDLAGQVHDLADESVADMLMDIDNALVGRHVQELREIEAARRRLADGSINRCIECDLGIGYKRLLAYPVAVRCVACQQQFEKTHHHEGTPRL